MEKRPTAVTVIAWILIATGGISLISIPVILNNPTGREMMAKSPIPISVQFVMMYVGLSISIISAIGMLKQQNWARLLYVAWSALGFSISLITSPMKTALIPGLLFFAIIVFFLFQPLANKYFSKS